MVDYYHGYRSKMQAARSRNVPPVPRTLTGLSRTLNHYVPMRHIYKGCVTTIDGSIGLIFMHDDMIRPLSECFQLFCDGTFKVRIA